MKKMEKPRKPLIFYYAIVLVVMILLNTLLFPRLMGQEVTQVDYGTFLTMLADRKVAVAQVEQDMIYFTDTAETPGVYATSAFNDPELVNRLWESGCRFAEVKPREMSPFLSFLLTFILPIAIFIGIGQLMSRALMKRMGGSMGGPMQFGKSSAKVYIASETGIKFTDVAGEDEAKENLMEVVDFLHNPQKYQEIGAKMPKGVLLVGPPGTGKTLLAKAVAGEAEVPKKRDTGMGGGNDEREQTLNQLLTEMDGFEGSKGVVILAATNRPETLDPALLRPGRFDRRVPVELPDLKGRESILKVHAARVKIGEDVDFNAIARAASGASGAELANMVNEAALRAVRQGRKFVTQADLQESIEVVIAGYQKKNKILTDHERLVVSYHEIGHALVAALQTHSAPVAKITIIPRTSGALGYTMQVEQEERNLMSREELENQIATLTGGRAAEELVFHSITTGASNDIEKATKVARAMVARYGMTEDFDMVALETVTDQYMGGDAALACAPETSARIDQMVVDIVKGQHEKARKLLRDNEGKLHELSKYLCEKETITGEEFMRILEKTN